MMQVPIVRACGVEVIVAAARAHVGSVHVSDNACRALNNLAFDAANRVLIDVFPGLCFVHVVDCWRTSCVLRAQGTPDSISHIARQWSVW